MKNAVRALIVLPLAILAAVVVMGALRGGAGEKRLPRPAIGDPARDFTYPGLDGNQVSLSDFRGKKVVFVNIWATWCTECKRELPTVQKMYEKYKGEDFEVLAVSIDALGAKAVVPFMEDLGLSFPALLDPTGSIQLLYGTTGVPETFIIDKKGNVAFVEIGAGDWTEPGKQALVRGLMDESVEVAAK
ncbi:MAG: TlpA disulfide reductase family protein [Thermodesulfovibrionales bacterium]